ncbi:alpha/beta hydrolase [Gallaecimonas pentaromativorans]|uniref:alpha/beta hydrolase n=1 Tax=Gallaecimonas pentaromativorans TaxID=584787 RepID=UPI003A8FA6CB
MNQRQLTALSQDAASGLYYQKLPAAGQCRGQLVLLHGVGGNESNLRALAEFLPPHWALWFVRGPLTQGLGQFAWFQVSFTAAGPNPNLDQAEASRQKLLAFIKSALDTTAPRVVAGFSQGGIMSASVALTEPEAVSGFGILSGRILPELAPQLASAERLAALEGFVAHGRYDNKLPIDWAEKATTWLTALGVRHQLKRYDMDHQLSAEECGDFSRWLGQLSAK